MSIKFEIREEREAWLKSGKSIEEFYKHLKEKSENVVYSSIKKARYKGVELCEGDIIVNDNKQYIIRDFTEKAVPIVDLVSNIVHNYFNKKWEFGNNFKKLEHNPHKWF